MEDIYSLLRQLQTQISAPPSYVDPEAQGLMGEGTSYHYGDAVQGSPFQSKYSRTMREVEPGLFMADFQNPTPGKNHKYDTLSAYYRIDPQTGIATMEGDPFETRQTAKRETVKDFLEHGVPLIAAAVGAGYAVNPAYGNVFGAAAPAAAEGVGTVGTIASGTGQVAPLSTMGQITMPTLAEAAYVPTMAELAGGGAGLLTPANMVKAASLASTASGATDSGENYSNEGRNYTGPNSLNAATDGPVNSSMNTSGFWDSLPQTMKEAYPWMRTAATLYGAYEGSQEQPGKQTSEARTLDPRIDARVFGENGLMNNMDNWYQTNKTGQNKQMLDAQAALRGLLTSPQMASGLKNQYDVSQGLFNLSPFKWGG